ncbi:MULTISPECIES: hypothetical protein [Kitasatospora]|uniref:Uncharacterized protein n=1 Tax=Kitasatospora cathayae TaxID=3004092 RepID=A0ABY7QFS8_9ACTN|nr:hypothetical protein [Kitasatospora sp. HUAS 3-15]WBP91264.1 hypothetical protein O1G21_38890 [Kitasatospora sp. HUAS 3-15]
MPEAVKPLSSYTWWGEVPDHLRPTTQLAALDLPRQPAGSVRATIETRNPGTGRKADFDAPAVPTYFPRSRVRARRC